MFNKKRLLLLTMTLMVVIAAFIGCGTTAQETDATPTAAQEVVVTPTVQPTAIPTATPAPTEVPIDYDNVTIKDVWAEYFYVGAVLNGSSVGTDTYKDLVKTHFNSLTMENEMKPDAVLDWMTSKSDLDKYNESPAISLSRAEAGLKYAQENGIKMRGHTLVWHSQTPKWFFTEGYSSDANAKFVSREIMLKRMENYIKQVLEYVQTNYPDVIYAWDVVNEAIQPSDGHAAGLRTDSSMWYQVIGEDYIEKAFEYARKYAAPGVKLFYNDYNTEESAKVVAIKNLAKKLIAQGTIDGIGMQTHINMDNPSLSEIDSSARTYADLGLELQVTELDVDLKTNTEEDFLKQATRYKRLFLYFKKWKEDGIKLTSVTFWGTTDNKSWLNKSNEPSYPLLFNDKLEKKPAYFAVLQDPDIPLY